MSILIKSTDLAHGFVIQKLGGESPQRVSTVRASETKAENPLAAENRRLAALVEEHEAKIAAHEGALATAYSKGEEAGRSAMEFEIQDDRAAALELLVRGVESAKTALDQTLGNYESIALIVAQTALDKIFGDTEGRKVMAADLIRHQLRQIGHDSFVSLEVSRADFPNTQEVAELATSLSVVPERVRVSDDLAAGSCQMRMQLGTLEIGLDRQWGSVRALLDEMIAIDETEDPR